MKPLTKMLDDFNQRIESLHLMPEEKLNFLNFFIGALSRVCREPDWSLALHVSSQLINAARRENKWCSQCGDLQELNTEGKCSNCGRDDCFAGEH